MTDPLVQQGSGLRVLRGGSWISAARYARSAARFGAAPGFRDQHLGVRPARPVTP